jgi:hypothetical protein
MPGLRGGKMNERTPSQKLEIIVVGNGFIIRWLDMSEIVNDGKGVILDTRVAETMGRATTIVADFLKRML